MYLAREKWYSVIMRLSPFIILGFLVGCSVPAAGGPQAGSTGPTAGTGGSAEALSDTGGGSIDGCGTLAQHVEFRSQSGETVSYDVLIPCDPHYHDTGDPPPDAERKDVVDPAPDLLSARTTTAKQAK